MNEILEERYFKWLCAKVTRPEASSQTYWTLLKILHSTEFVWIVLGDDNRLEDGKDLRHEYLRAAGIGRGPESFDLAASVLEVFIAFARRCEFQTETSVRDWFWEFITNLGLQDEYDAGGVNKRRVDKRINTFIWRLYDDDGNGGLFPLSHFRQEDQRKVEIWYQFCEYLVDQERY